MSSIFTRIIEGEIPARLIHEDDLCVAFLDAVPLTHGHTLVVPRAEVGHWVDLEPQVAAHLMSVAQRVGQAQMRAFGPERIGLVIAGYEVDHTHLHVIPTRSLADLDLTDKLPEDERSDALLDDDAEALRAALRA